MDIGELHCTVKHVAATHEVIGEIIEKYVRQSLDADSLIKVRGLLQVVWMQLFRMIKSHESGEYLFEDSMELIDLLRRIRAELHNEAYEVIYLVDESSIGPILVEFLKAIGNLYNAEIHLLDYLITIMKERVKHERKEVIEATKEEKAKAEA